MKWKLNDYLMDLNVFTAESSDNHILGNLAEVLQQCQQDQIKYSMELEKKKKSQKEKRKSSQIN